jgi:hypothetical protein
VVCRLSYGAVITRLAVHVTAPDMLSGLLIELYSAHRYNAQMCKQSLDGLHGCEVAERHDHFQSLVIGTEMETFIEILMECRLW